MRWMAAVIATGALIASQPAATETLHLEGVFAAGAREASLLPTIGVDALRGPAGEIVEAAVERQLARLGEDGAPHAEVVAPSLRPDGLLTGWTDVAVDENPYVESRSRCVEKDKDRKCIRRETFEVRCLRRTVRLRADFSLVRARDRRAVYAVSKAREDFDSGCEDGGGVAPVDASLRSMADAIAREVRLDLAPHRDRYTIRIREERAGLAPADADRFRSAVRLTKRDEAAACRAFAAIGESAPDHGPTLFNRALCAEADGRYADATDLYTRARVYGTGFGGDITKGLNRASALAAGREDARRIAMR